MTWHNLVGFFKKSGGNWLRVLAWTNKTATSQWRWHERGRLKKWQKTRVNIQRGKEHPFLWQLWPVTNPNSYKSTKILSWPPWAYLFLFFCFTFWWLLSHTTFPSGHQLTGTAASTSLSVISSWMSSVFPESLLAAELNDGELLPPLIMRRQVSICTSSPRFMLHISMYSCKWRFMSLLAVANSIWAHCGKPPNQNVDQKQFDCAFFRIIYLNILICQLINRLVSYSNTR